jgi:membrane associated rhomboid family serine protease
MMPLTDVVKNLLIINVLVFICTNLLNFGINLDFYFVLFPVGSEYFKPFQIVTSMFNHGNTQHIMFNMLALVFIGPLVEQSLGPKRFLFLYLSAGLLSSVFSLLFTQHSVVGASGAINGVMVAMALMYPNMKMTIFPIPIPIKAIILVSIYIIYDFISGVSGANTGIGHFAHLGGALMGAILIFHWGLSNLRIR